MNALDLGTLNLTSKEAESLWLVLMRAQVERESDVAKKVSDFLWGDSRYWYPLTLTNGKLPFQ